MTVDEPCARHRVGIGAEDFPEALSEDEIEAAGESKVSSQCRRCRRALMAWTLRYGTLASRST